MDDIKDVLSVLENETKKIRRTIQEKLFVERHLPVLALVHDEPVNLMGWIEICGSPYESVDIVDATGNLKFTVPPLFSRPPTSVAGKREASMSALINNAALEMERLPVVGARMLVNGMASRGKYNKVDVDGFHKWNEILVHYGYEAIEVEGLEEKAPAPTGTFNLNDFEEF